MGTGEGKERRNLQNERVWYSRMDLSIQSWDLSALSELIQSTNPCEVLTVHECYDVAAKKLNMMFL